MSKYLLTLPKIPAGQDFARDSFWWIYRERFERPMRLNRTIRDASYKWFDIEERRAILLEKPFPPKPIFRKAPPKMPQPNTGKDGANGWTPRNS